MKETATRPAPAVLGVASPSGSEAAGLLYGDQAFGSH